MLSIIKNINIDFYNLLNFFIPLVNKTIVVINKIERYKEKVIKIMYSICKELNMKYKAIGINVKTKLNTIVNKTDKLCLTTLVSSS